MNSPATIVDPQRLVIEFLSCPESYGLQDVEIERVETHCSVVFLVGDRAYKLKRAIRYASLDYTTPELRRRACEAELLLNRRTAPDIYLEVRAITRDSRGWPAFDDSGSELDYVVVMRRFARSSLFDHLAETGELTPGLMRTLGERIAQFHAVAAPAADFGGTSAIARVIANNEGELALVATALDGVTVGSLSHRTRTVLKALSPLLDKRRAQGSVRRCHGDLRLANICLYDGLPTLFDCIEFSDDIGCIDVLYDLAFLLMDLHLRGCFELENAVFNAYLDHTGETDGLRALPLFLSLRAATRSYALAGAVVRRTDPRQAAELAERARRHIRAAIDFLGPKPPSLVLLGGGDARRRGDVAAELAGLIGPAPGARILRLGTADPIARAKVILAAGCSVLLEGEFSDRDMQSAVAALPLPATAVPLWLGPLPAGADATVWHRLNDRADVAAVVRQAALQLGVATIP